VYGIQRLGSPLFRLAWGLETHGTEHVPATGGVLLCPNHASYLDPWWIGNSLTMRSWRNLITDRWYDRNAVLRALFRASGTIPTATGRPGTTVSRVLTAVAAGDAVTVFPEGGISRDGRLRRGRVGVAWMAAATGAPVLPCGIRGGFEAFPRSRRIPRFRPVEIHVGAPIRFPGAPEPSRPSPEATESFLTELMARIATLADKDPPGRR
jgi:1-acyl-sn-glycerol-3-phosphate acyltransferase